MRQVTNASIVKRPLTPEAAMDIVEGWFELPHVIPMNPGGEHLVYLQRCLNAVGVGGNLVTDCHIAAMAMEYGAVVHSNDADFGRFPGLSWRNSL